MKNTETSRLNDAQKLASTHLDGPLLVLAGAGSGKTKVLVERIAYLVKEGVSPSKIVAVTFTNKAAGEMRERVRKETNANILACTFHSLCARVLREGITELGYSDQFTIYDEKDSEQVLKSCLETLNFKAEKEDLKRFKHQISDLKNEVVSPSNVQEKDLRDVYALYQERLKEYNALDFDDLLFLTVQLFRTTERGKEFQSRWSFVLVDEFQDTNSAQYEICKHLVATTNNLFVVGDPDQSIYSWRGANMNNILHFEQDFPGAKVIPLQQNYRSTNTILKAANALIANNTRPYTKELFSDLGEGDKVGIHIFRSDKEEAQFVISKIEEHLPEIPANEIVVFYRTNSQSRIFEDYLLKAGISYVIIGGFSFYQRKEIKDILAYLRLVVSPADFISFVRTINLPKRGFGNSFLEKIKTLCEEFQIPIMLLLHKIMSGEVDVKLSAKQRSGLLEYLQVFAEVEKMQNRNEPLDQIIRQVIMKSRYLDYLQEDKETYQERKSNIEELMGKAFEWQGEAEEPKLNLFLEELSLKSSTDESVRDEDQVRLMTLHNSKGLEFDLCFIVGMEEDVFPHINAKEDGLQGIEEERRLCYVGMTRAKKHLHMSAARFRFLWGTPRTMRPSQFLEEVPEEFVSRSQGNFVSSDYYNHSRRVKPLESRVEEAPSQGEFAIDSQVVHKDFGKGVVKKAYQTSLGLTYDVLFFNDNIKRTLVAKYAKLSST